MPARTAGVAEIAGMDEFTARDAERTEGPGLELLEQALGYRFVDRALIEQALTHSSFAHERRILRGRDPARSRPSGSGRRHGDNEQLEFLGDAILGFLISDMLYRERPDLREGELSRIKAFVVSAANLVLASDRIGLGPHLRLGKGEEKTGGREKRALLVDAFEALIAAVYLDGGIEPVRRVIASLFSAQVRESVASGEPVSDFKSVLQERLQGEGRPPARYQLIEEVGPSHQRLFTVAVLIDGEVSGTAQGPTKKSAEQRAAMDALARHWRNPAQFTESASTPAPDGEPAGGPRDGTTI